MMCCWIAIRHLSQSYIALHEADRAMPLANESFAMAKSLLPPSHYKITCYMNVVGECYRSVGDYDNALSWHDETRQLLERIQCSPSRDLSPKLASTHILSFESSRSIQLVC
jgi:hypothetical protein